MKLEDAVSYFSKELNDNKDNLSLEEKRKIARMLIKEVLLCRENIVINHIINIDTKGTISKNAGLNPNGVRGFSQKYPYSR